MRTKMKMLFALLTAASLMFTIGCVTKEKEVRTEQAPPVVERQVVEKQVLVQPPAPAPRVEVIPAAPSVGYTWVPGFWQWNGRDYNWIPGYWRQQ